MIEIIDAGALTTVQDLGRYGRAAEGIAPSGAMDAFALRAANMLVGNDEGTAALEFTLHGPTLRFRSETAFALTGSLFEATLDQEPVALGCTTRARAGQSLRIGRALDGARGYLAVHGGIDVPAVLGSRSTYVAAQLGPSPVARGDVIALGRARHAPPRRLRDGALPRWEGVLRALDGPQADVVDANAFYSETFSVTPRADRTGIRLEGTPVALRAEADLDPEGVPNGSVQIPGDGRPIILCADRPITGGYVKAAVVIAADAGLLAHLRPGDTLRFMRVTIEDARAALDDRERALRDGIA